MAKKKSRKKARPVKRRTAPKPRKTMATKTKRRKASKSKPAPRRRSGARRSGMGKFAPVLMAVAAGAAGYVGASYLMRQPFMQKLSATNRGLALGIGGAALAVFMPAAAPLALGVAMNGAVQLASSALKLGAAVNGLPPADRAALVRYAGPRMNGTRQDADMVNGRSDASMVNGTNEGDRAYTC